MKFERCNGKLPGGKRCRHQSHLGGYCLIHIQNMDEKLREKLREAVLKDRRRKK